jgi:PPM family protein phosphatase
MDLTESIDIVCRTDTGQKRDHNEDAVGSDNSLGLVVLADGMGGYQAGEVASAMAVDIVLSDIQGKHEQAMLDPLDDFSGMSAASTLIENAILKANAAIHSSAQEKPQYQGMGTTIVVVMMHENIVSIGHVGDSRLYRLRDNKLELVTEDHSLVRELVRKGYYTEAEAREATNKNVVTRALGVDAKVEPEVQEDMALLDDIYLLCSDGLNDMVEDAQIENILQRYGADLEQTADQLIQLANEMGGKDNISAILLRPVKPFVTKLNWYGRIGQWFTAKK